MIDDRVINETPYNKSKVNSQMYAKWRTEWGQFFKSERYFFENNLKAHLYGMSILDIGGGAGGAGYALKQSIEPNITYTCLDVDKQAIFNGKKKFKNLKFIEGRFPDALSEQYEYDLVMMFALFPQLPNWKNILQNMCKFSKRFVNFSCALRLSGSTLIDLDTSFFYYLDSGERVHQVIHNIYELINYLSITELGVSHIHFYGYRVLNHQPDSFRPLPNNEIIFGNFLLELNNSFYDNGRTGGCSQLKQLSIDGVVRGRIGPSLSINIEDNVCKDSNEIGALAKRIGLT